MFQAAVACGSAYESLFNNVDNITDAWASMMGHLASTFKGVAGIVGIELINEPFVGNPYKSLRLMLPAHIADAALIGAEYGLAADLVSNLTALGEILANFTENNPNANADYINLQSAYDTVATSIHEADDERIVLFSPVTLANFGPGVTHPPGGEQYADTSVLAFHWYKPPQMGDGSFQASVFSHAAKELSVASILSETYAPANELGLDYFQTPGGVADSMDAATPPQGYVTWAYKPFCRESQETLTSTSQNGVWGACKTGYGLLWDEGSSLPPKINDQTRTYAPAIAGAVKLMKYDAATGEFELRFVIDGTIDAPTEIFASAEYTYPNDVSVTLDPPNVAQSARQGDYIIVWPLDGASGTELTVKVQHTTPQIKLAAQTNGAGHGGPYN
jgi:endoglycosylceramidase